MEGIETNADRAGCAMRALAAVPEKYGDVLEDDIVDLVSDLMHLAFQAGCDSIDRLLTRAQMHFIAEMEEEN